VPDGLALDRRRRLLAEALLVGVTAVWGWTFVVVKDAVSLLPPLPFLAVRFGVATFVMALVMGLMRSGKRRRRADGDTPGAIRRSLAPGLTMGAFLAAGYIFQTFGLQRTTASNAGFITGMFVVLVPILQGLVWRVLPDTRAVLGVGAAAVGLFLLSGGASELHLLGDGLVFLCALSFSAHILATSRYARYHDAGVLTVLQLGVVAVLCAAFAATGAMFGVPLSLQALWEPEVLVALGVTALLASAAAFYIQTFAQRYASPTRTAIILTMEPVFAGLFGYAFAGERLTLAGWIGAAAILAGMLIAELRVPSSRRRSRVGEV
jgi:drug/metabolite transporter (DMT)-like permease